MRFEQHSNNTAAIIIIIISDVMCYDNNGENKSITVYMYIVLSIMYI